MTYLVTGATGTVGRQIVQQLISAGHSVRALSRNPETANLPAGVEVVAGDVSSTKTLEPALEGVTGLHLITFAGAEQTPLENAAEIVEAAVKAGVQRVSVLQGGFPGPVEEAVQNSTLKWTLLVPVEFMANTVEWAESIKAEGVVREGFPEARSAMVHEADIAAVAVAALTGEGHEGKSYTLTGPEALTPAEKVRILSTALGQDVKFIELSQDQIVEQWRSEGYTAEDIEFFLQMRVNPPEESYTVSPDVERVTGRAPFTYAQWASENVDKFRS